MDNSTIVISSIVEIKRGHEIVKYILIENSNDNKSSVIFGVTPLSISSKNGNQLLGKKVGDAILTPLGESLIILSIDNSKVKKTRERTTDPEKLKILEEEGYIESLSSEQSVAFEKIVSDNNNYFITGDAGTGKTVLLKHIRKYFLQNNVNTAVVALQGYTARMLGGSTIHSFFKLGMKSFFDPSENIESKIINSDYKRYWVNLDCLIIDEISMVSPDILDRIDLILRYANNTDLPFGGKKILLFGDLFQIPPVITNKKDGAANFDEASLSQADLSQIEYGTHQIYPPFLAHSWSKLNLSFIRLTQVFRQKNDPLEKILKDIKFGNITLESYSMLEDRIVGNLTIIDESYVYMSHRNDVVKNHNEKFLNKIEGEEKMYLAKKEGVYEKITNDSQFPTDPVLTLKVGAKVMMVKNDINKRWQNGTMGTVVKMEQQSVRVKINDMEYRVESETWTDSRFKKDLLTNQICEEVVGRFTQLPIRLAYGVTIHKSQGQTYDKVCIDISTMTKASHGLIYVAMSRCKSLAGIALIGRINNDLIKVDQEILHFYNSIKWTQLL